MSSKERNKAVYQGNLKIKSLIQKKKVKQLKLGQETRKV